MSSLLCLSYLICPTRAFYFDLFQRCVDLLQRCSVPEHFGHFAPFAGFWRELRLAYRLRLAQLVVAVIRWRRSTTPMLVPRIFTPPPALFKRQIGEGPTLSERRRAACVSCTLCARAARSPCARTHSLRARGPLTPAPPLRRPHPNHYSAQAIRSQAFPCVFGCLDWALGEAGIRVCA